MAKKDADRLARDLRSHFTDTDAQYTVEKRGGHWFILNARGKHVYSFAGTPSDNRFRPNTIAALRRLGVVPHGWRG